MRRILSAEDVRRAERKEAIGALFAVEGADVLENDVEIEQAYADGVRMLSLTWNTSNAFGGGIKENSQGLTPRGRRLIQEKSE